MELLPFKGPAIIYTLWGGYTFGSGTGISKVQTFSDMLFSQFPLKKVSDKNHLALQLSVLCSLHSLHVCYNKIQTFKIYGLVGKVYVVNL